MDLLSVRAMDSLKYALALMDAVFDDKDMAVCCFSRGKRGTKSPLPQEKIKLIEGDLNSTQADTNVTSKFCLCSMY